MAKRKTWMPAKPAKAKVKLSPAKMAEIQNLCQPIVKLFKEKFVKSNPDKSCNYLVDVYTKWYRNYLYFCEKYQSEHPNRISDEYESKFVRLEYTTDDQFNFSYFRHTGQWFLIANDVTLNDCLEMMRDNPSFQPIG